MPVVDLVGGLVAGDADLVGVDDDDEIAGIDVRRVDGLVLAAQTECHFAGNTSEHLVGGVNHKPLVRHFGRLGAEGLHEDLAGRSPRRTGGTARSSTAAADMATAAFGTACAGGLSGQSAVKPQPRSARLPPGSGKACEYTCSIGRRPRGRASTAPARVWSGLPRARSASIRVNTRSHWRRPWTPHARPRARARAMQRRQTAGRPRTPQPARLRIGFRSAR